MTAKELTDRYKSDIKAARNAHENGVLSQDDFEATVMRLDNRLFEDLEMVSIVTPTEELERILAYS